MSASPREILRNNVKEKLARGEVVSSITVRLVRSIEIARIAKTAGFDSIYVDVEHSSLSLETTDRKSTRLNSSHQIISYAVFCLKKKNNDHKLKLRVTPID